MLLLYFPFISVLNFYRNYNICLNIANVIIIILSRDLVIYCPFTKYKSKIKQRNLGEISILLYNILFLWSNSFSSFWNNTHGKLLIYSHFTLYWASSSLIETPIRPDDSQQPTNDRLLPLPRYVVVKKCITRKELIAYPTLSKRPSVTFKSVRCCEKK